VLDATAFSLGI